MPGDLLDGTPVNGEDLWYTKRLRLTVQCVCLGCAAIEDERTNIAAYRLHAVFALYTLVVAARSVGELVDISVYVPSTIPLGFSYATLAQYIASLILVATTPCAPPLHFPPEQIYSEKSDTLLFSYTTEVVMLGNTAESLETGDLPIVPADMCATTMSVADPSTAPTHMQAHVLATICRFDIGGVLTFALFTTNTSTKPPFAFDSEPATSPDGGVAAQGDEIDTVHSAIADNVHDVGATEGHDTAVGTTTMQENADGKNSSPESLDGAFSLDVRAVASGLAVIDLDSEETLEGVKNCLRPLARAPVRCVRLGTWMSKVEWPWQSCGKGRAAAPCASPATSAGGGISGGRDQIISDAPASPLGQDRVVGVMTAGGDACPRASATQRDLANAVGANPDAFRRESGR
ncbi:uncharacterized protein B0H18DRAFT_1123798 [Fomitopsis serialis]|uniref:uncharacterized protein n=1 Tax=Fomitopsis serialis TaxID=139415 RepID=UPI002007A0B9|nr:uncharacterized protein B0H18DRAFT_1123798 [Neoantrodia serialis]KAH9917206.1 hypothetical protein B0H18DRAFT_1123798 [Neoantrodia serialis]